ncbi:cytochrome c biogenesis protein CcsA [Holosporaceae bacterium 'Namur']|nr:cytochrome c biogenesis protein CcsA [Holosporaceae bacterium 'Namur']
MNLLWLNPSKFEQHFKVLIYSLAIIFISTTSCALFLVFKFVPDDYLQKELVKIMYIHVPAAWLSLMLYACLSIFGMLFLIFHNPFYDIISKSFAGVGSFMTLITLLTGSIWGKPAWGTWWVWDARLTSMLILFFIYITYILIRDAFENEQRAAKVSAVFALIGLINIPIIKFSVYLWNTLHQGASVIRFGSPTIHKSMLYPLLTIFLGFLAFAFLMVIIEIKSELYARKLKKLSSK